MKHFISTLFLTFLTTAVFATDYYFRGAALSGGTSAWETATNWSLTAGGPGDGAVPTAADNAYIENVVLIVSSAECLNLIIEEGSEIVINASHSLTIKGNCTSNQLTYPLGVTFLLGGTSTSPAKIIFDGTAAQTIKATNIPIKINNIWGVVEINNASGVTIANAFDIELQGVLAPIAGTLTTNGKLILKAPSSTQYARVALNDGVGIASRVTYTGTISGNLTMENTLGTTLQTSTPSGGFYQGDWFQLSYPLQTADLSSGWSGITLNTTGVASTQNIWSWDATSSGNTQVGADFPDANGWTPAVNAEPNWDDKAYTVFLSSDAPFAASQTWSLTGTADLSDVTYDALIHNTADPNGPVATTIATDPAGWVLLRNPWPSNIETDSWFTSLSGGGVDDGSWGLEYIAVHVYNTIAGQYEGWTTSDITPISSVDYNTAGGVADRATSATQNIPPFQAFWVKTSSASAGTLTLKKKFSTTAISSKVFQKTSSTLPETAVLMSYDEDSLRDITLVYYDNNKTNQFDMRGDIYKRMSDNPGWPNLYIEEAGNKAQSAGRPFKAVDTVEVYYESPKNNTMAHLWLNDTNIAAAYSIMLFDKLTQQTQNMRTNPSYSFTHNVNNNANRFQLILTNNSIGIEESDLDENPINIYATQDELVIESESYTGAAFITLYDMAGRRVMSRKIEVTEGVKMRTQLPTGMANALYTVEIEFDGRVVVEKIMR